MPIKVITAPSAALTLEQLRRHCRIDPPDSANDVDTDLSAALAAAQAYAQHYTGISIGSQTLELALDEFPADGPIQLLQGPVTSITSVQYIDTAEVEQTITSTDYTLDDYATPAWLVPAYDVEWPDTLATTNAVKVRYVAGAATIDGAVAAALRLLVGHYFTNREAIASGTVVEIPLGVRALLDTVKDYGGRT